FSMKNITPQKVLTSRFAHELPRRKRYHGICLDEPEPNNVNGRSTKNIFCPCHLFEISCLCLYEANRSLKMFHGVRKLMSFSKLPPFWINPVYRDSTRIDNQLIEATLQMWPESAFSTGERVCQTFPFSKFYGAPSKRRQKNPPVAASGGDNPHGPL